MPEQPGIYPPHQRPRGYRSRQGHRFFCVLPGDGARGCLPRGTGCHTTGALVGQPDPQRYLAGSTIGFQIPELGIVYPPNLTPDRATGLGDWSEREIVNAVRTGVRPDGRVLVPVMPYHSYSRLTDADVGALASYLKSLPPVRHQVPANTGASEKPTTPYLTVAMPE